MPSTGHLRFGPLASQRWPPYFFISLPRARPGPSPFTGLGPSPTPASESQMRRLDSQVSPPDRSSTGSVIRSLPASSCPASGSLVPGFLRHALLGLGVLVLVLLVSSPALLEAQAQAPFSSLAPDDRPVVLVTGSTDGLGRELALELGTMGAHVIVHGRNEERGRQVVDAIEADGRGSARLFLADFGELVQVSALAREIRTHYDRLDILVNNAGVGPGAPGHERVLTPDGYELRFQVNYLAGYLLTRELLPLLQSGAPSRIVNVTSRNQQTLDFDDLDLDEGYQGGAAYGRSKLAQILFTTDLSEELEGTGVSAFAVHPAPAMDTGLVRETGSTPQSSVERGLASVLRVAIEAGLESGQYFHELEERRAHEQAYDPEARRLLRERSDERIDRALGR